MPGPPEIFRSCCPKLSALGYLPCLSSPAASSCELFTLRCFPVMPPTCLPQVNSELGQTMPVVSPLGSPWSGWNRLDADLCTQGPLAVLWKQAPGSCTGRHQGQRHKALPWSAVVFFLTQYFLGCCKLWTVFQSSDKVGSDSFCLIFCCFCWGDRPSETPTLPCPLASESSLIFTT